MPALLLRGVVLAVLWLAVLGRGHAQDLSAEREQFVDALTALSTGDEATFRRIEQQLRDYPLRSYLGYAALTRHMSSATPAEIRAFLVEQGAAPLGPRLRKRWLRHSAATGQWRVFLEDYKPGLGTDIDCRHLEAQFRTGARKAALRNVPKLWISASSRPDACDPIFQLWIEAGGPSRDQVWKRLQMASRGGQLRLAKYLKRFLPPSERSTADLWIDGYRQPAKMLDSGALDPQLTQATPIAVHAMLRLARIDPEAAASLLATASERYKIPADSIAALRYKIAIGLAVDGHPGAAFWLDSVPAPVRDASLRAWNVRTHLRNRDWHQVLTAIESMPASEGGENHWRYWRARALESLGESDPASTEYRALAGLRDYHGFLAADRLGLAPSIKNSPLQVDAAVKRRLLHRPAMQRARELYALDRVSEADLEWRFALTDANADEYRAAAKIAHDWGWYYQGIATVARARDWDDLDLRFPTRYQALVLSAARRNRIDPAWIFGVMRQESMFHPTIRSHAGAIGLMQIMPATGRRVAKGLGMPWSGKKTLVQPEDNIGIGSRYLRMGLDRLQGRHIFATAGYNAGPARVEQWLDSDESMPADVWIELVPFRETRRYLRKVVEYTVIYQHRLGHRTDFVARVMLPIEGRNVRKTASLLPTAPDRSLFPG